MKTVKEIIVTQEPGKEPDLQALDVAIANGFNCYSKPWGDQGYQDRRTDSEMIVHFSKHPVILQVRIALVS